jgi:hypothetical protein
MHFFMGVMLIFVAKIQKKCEFQRKKGQCVKMVEVTKSGRVFSSLLSAYLTRVGAEGADSPLAWSRAVTT